MSLYKGNNLISGAMPNSANQSLSNLNSAGQDIIDGKVDLNYSNADYQPVNKAGDTMTGALTITSTSPRITQGQSGITKGTNPSEAFYMGIQFNDKNSDSASHYSKTRLGLIELQSLSDGTERIVIAPYRNVANSTDNAAFAISIPRSGDGYCTFPNTTCCDGQYVNTNTTIATNVSVNGSSNLIYTLNLPSDGRLYMVWIMVEANTGSASGNYVNAKIGSDVMSSTTLARATTRTTSSISAGSTACIVVSSSHKIYLSRTTDWNGTVSLSMKGYRRIGTNA